MERWLSTKSAGHVIPALAVLWTTLWSTTGSMQAKRMVLRLPGKSGRVPNPLEKGVLANEPGVKVRYEFDADGKPKGCM